MGKSGPVSPNAAAGAHAAPVDAATTTSPPGVAQGASTAPSSTDKARSSLRRVLPPRDAPAAVIENMIYEHLDGPARPAWGADALETIHAAVQSRQRASRTTPGANVGHIQRADDGSFSVKCGEDLLDARSADEVRLHLLLEQHFDAKTGTGALSGHDGRSDQGNPGKSVPRRAKKVPSPPFQRSRKNLSNFTRHRHVSVPSLMSLSRPMNPKRRHTASLRVNARRLLQTDQTAVKLRFQYLPKANLAIALQRRILLRQRRFRGIVQIATDSTLHYPLSTFATRRLWTHGSLRRAMRSKI